ERRNHPSRALAELPCSNNRNEESRSEYEPADVNTAQNLARVGCHRSLSRISRDLVLLAPRAGANWRASFVQSIPGHYYIDLADMDLLILVVCPAEQLGGGAIVVRLGVVVLLVAINAFFVASEFALVAVRRSRIDEMAEAGDRGGRQVQCALLHLDRYIAGAQLGITLASLGLGWVGEPAIAIMID